MAQRTIYLNYDPKQPHEFVCSRRANFSLKVNNCVKTGAQMIVTDLPDTLSDEQIQAIAQEAK